ncbi:creatininase family protein [Paenibacillus arenilitoris]|uniref:Creatininase family protein n=1 Tax=Paenibacillus arenilitoris TaxID=2772299 RepID=A0A927CR44_9BACL|nr:creatininase family protein [Paenibacillus arenilitoris]MBD2871980.1 creatininase family protein [Paenibacillus arenilitoris]
MSPNTGSKTLWAELLPYEFKQRMEECPVVYLPLGLCEPHGQVSALGLDTLKAEWLCRKAAERTGGIVAPSMGYHIHETGYHAGWLEQTVGEQQPPMTSIPPDIMLAFFLYQLRSFANAGFKAVVVVSGHSGGNQEDLRQAAALFMKHVPVTVWVRSDPELVEGLFEGDHAGKYELSQLMFIRPDLVDPAARRYEGLPGYGGRLAIGHDAHEADAERGRAILEACLTGLCAEVSRIKREVKQAGKADAVSHSTVRAIWSELLQSADRWVTASPWSGQEAVSERSIWKPYEYYRIQREGNQDCDADAGETARPHNKGEAVL